VSLEQEKEPRKKLRDTRIGQWLRTSAPNVLEVVGDALPDSDDPKTLLRLLQLAPKISTREGFVDEYFQRLKDHDTRANAYWSVEHDHMSIFGRTRYNGHEVFASVLSR